MKNNSGEIEVPFFKASLGQDELKRVSDVLNSGWLTTGPVSQELEKLCADLLGVQSTLAVSSGTAALAICYRLAGFERQKVVIPSYTFGSCITELLHMNATPVLVDIDESTMNLDIDKAIETVVEEKAKGLVTVHFAGQPCDMNKLQSASSEYGFELVDDACHAFGSIWNGKRIGSFNSLSAFSFYATKNITTAEGGLISTSRYGKLERARVLSLHGISKDAWKRYTAEGSWFYEIVEAGYKANMPDVLAAIGIVQAAKADELLEKRKLICLQYDKAFSEHETLILPPHKTDESSYHLYPLRLRLEQLKITRTDFIQILKEKGIHCSVHFIPAHIHPYFREHLNFNENRLLSTMKVYESEVSLPLFPDMKSEQVDKVINVVTDLLLKYRR